MKTIKLILGVILILVVLGFVGNSITTKKAYAQEKPTIKDLVGTWINEEMMWDKLVVEPDGAWFYYKRTTDKFPRYEGMITFRDSWIDENGNKYIKTHTLGYVFEEPRFHFFDLNRLNKAGTVWEFNSYEDFEYRSEKDDVPEKYPTEIDPHPTDSVYRIYYRQ